MKGEAQPKIEKEAEAKRRRADSRYMVMAGVLVTGLGLVAKIIGIVRERVVAHAFGATRGLDGFLVAKTLPDMFATWIEMPLRAAFVPIFTKRLHEEGEEAAWRAASNVINTVAVFLVLLSVLLFFGAPFLVRAMSWGFQDERVWSASSEQGRILVLSIVFSVLAVLLGSLQNIYRRQVFPAVGRVVNAVVLIICIMLLAKTMGLRGYAFGILAGAAATLLIQLSILYRYRRFYSFTLRPRAPEIREVLTVALPLFIGLTGTRLDVLLDRLFTSFLPAGHLSILSYAIVLSGVVTDLVLTISGSVLLPSFAKMLAEKRREEVRSRLSYALGGCLYFMLPFTAILVAGSEEVAGFIYQTGEFRAEDTRLLSLALPLFAVAAPFYGMAQIISQVYIGNADTRTPMIAGFWRIGFKLLLSLSLLMWLWSQDLLFWGFVALAAASSISTFFRLGLMWHWLPRDVRPDTRRFLWQMIRLLLAGGGAAAFVAVFFHWYPVSVDDRWSHFLRLAAAGLGAAGIHTLAAKMLGVDMLGSLLRALRSK